MKISKDINFLKKSSFKEKLWNQIKLYRSLFRKWWT
jgi:hypothetical protein